MKKRLAVFILAITVLTVFAGCKLPGTNPSASPSMVPSIIPSIIPSTIPSDENNNNMSPEPTVAPPSGSPMQSAAPTEVSPSGSPAQSPGASA